MSALIRRLYRGSSSTGKQQDAGSQEPVMSYAPSSLLGDKSRKLEIFSGLPNVILDGKGWHWVMVLPLEVNDVRNRAQWDKGVQNPEEKARHLFTDYAWRESLVQITDFPVGMSNREFHNKVREKIVELLISSSIGFQLHTQTSIDEDELFILIRIPTEDDIDTAEVHAHAFELRMPVRPSSYPVDEENQRPLCPTREVKAGAFVGEDYCPMHLQYDKSRSSRFADFRQVDLIRIAFRKVESVLNTKELIRQKVITSFFPVHDWDYLASLNEKGWNSLWPTKMFRWPSARNTEDVRNYFGEEVAFFFHWFSYYIRMLSIPVVLSMVAMFRNVIPFSDEEKDLIQVGFAIILCLWAAAFMNLYKQDESFLVQRWGMTNLTVVLEPRKEFKTEKRGSRQETMMKVVIWFIAFMFIAWICVATYVANLITQHAVNKEASQEPLLGIGGTEGKGNQQMIAAIFTFVNVKSADQIWKRLAPILTERENWKTYQEVEKMIIYRLFTVKSLIYYIPFWYLAFVKYYAENWAERNTPDSPRTKRMIEEDLQIQLYVFFAAHVVGGFATNMLPALLTWFNVKRELMVIKTKYEGKDYSYLQVQAKSPSPEDVKYRDAIMEIIIGLGFIMMFAIILSRICVISFVVSMIDMKLFAWSMSYSVKRPYPRQAEGLQGWTTVLLYLSHAGVICNLLIIIFLLKPLSSDDVSDATRWTVFIIAEHVMIILKGVIVAMIPEKSVAQITMEETNEQFSDDVLGEEDALSRQVFPCVPVRSSLAIEDHQSSKEEVCESVIQMRDQQQELNRASRIARLKARIQRDEADIAKLRAELEEIDADASPAERTDGVEDAPPDVLHSIGEAEDHPAEWSHDAVHGAEEGATTQDTSAKSPDGFLQRPKTMDWLSSVSPRSPMSRDLSGTRKTWKDQQPFIVQIEVDEPQVRPPLKENTAPWKAPETIPECMEFTITVDRSHGEKLGVKIEKHCIESIDPKWAVSKWNQGNPGKEVRIGDEIVEVNGKIDWWEIAAEMKHPQVTNMRFRRSNTLQSV